MRRCSIRREVVAAEVEPAAGDDAGLVGWQEWLDEHEHLHAFVEDSLASRIVVVVVAVDYVEVDGVVPVNTVAVLLGTVSHPGSGCGASDAWDGSLLDGWGDEGQRERWSRVEKCETWKIQN